MELTNHHLVPDTACQPHFTHGAERVWTESNCYTDIWTEALHALAMDPVAGFGYMLGATFQADQWSFIKPYPTDLEVLYGLDVREINPWRPLPAHVAEELGRGNLLTIEVDSFHLPDTAGVSYGLEHVKTTIIPTSIEPGRRLTYFHGAGHHELVGEDYEGLFDSAATREGGRLSPYVELIRRRRAPATASELVGLAKQTAREHLARRDPDNPAAVLAGDISARMEDLRTAGSDYFHQYAFVTCRQAGATAELAADFVDWLAAHGDRPPEDIAPLFRSVAQAAKSLQFSLARAARGRRVDVCELLTGLLSDWGRAVEGIDHHLHA